MLLHPVRVAILSLARLWWWWWCCCYSHHSSVVCWRRGDLIRVLMTLGTATDAAGDRKYDHVILETTGLADPHPIANVLFDATTGLGKLYTLNAVVTVVDAKNFEQALAEKKPAGGRECGTLHLTQHHRVLFCNQHLTSVAAAAVVTHCQAQSTKPSSRSSRLT